MISPSSPPEILPIHQSRMQQPPVRIVQLLAFLLTDEEYGIDIRMVKEIIRLTEITRVPRAPSYIHGIISLRGTVLPIFDLRQLLSMPDSKPDKKNRILIVSLEAGLIGIIVDAVTEVLELNEAELEPAPTVMTSLEADHIKGLGRYKGRPDHFLRPRKGFIRPDTVKLKASRSKTVPSDTKNLKHGVGRMSCQKR